LAKAITLYAPQTQAVYVCGGGAYNSALLRLLQTCLQDQHSKAQIATTEALGISPSHVEALAFAWLAAQFTQRLPGNLAAVTGARGPRILGALYPA